MQNLTNIAFFFSLLLRRSNSFDTFIKNFTFSQKKIHYPVFNKRPYRFSKIEQILHRILKTPVQFLKNSNIDKNIPL